MLHYSIPGIKPLQKRVLWCHVSTYVCVTHVFTWRQQNSYQYYYENDDWRRQLGKSFYWVVENCIVCKRQRGIINLQDKKHLILVQCFSFVIVAQKLVQSS